mmetsp:Transcript_20862/g.61797  ORF Transcript_20862/g.61797 Transcript_20862/m.61797 type:complete len:81 (+) Transcript_20862:412-654(+)
MLELGPTGGRARVRRQIGHFLVKAFGAVRTCWMQEWWKACPHSGSRWTGQCAVSENFSVQSPQKSEARSSGAAGGAASDA